MITNNSSKIPHSKIEYYCEMCEYKTRNKKDYNKHILTSKHQKNVLLTQQRISLTTTKQDAKLPNTCDLCNKCYGSRVGLWYHKKKCIGVNDTTMSGVIDKTTDEENKISITNNIPMELILEVIKQSKEIQSVLVEQNKELQTKLLEQGEKLLEKENLVIDQQKQLIEMAKKPSMVNSNNNSNNNNHFNLNFFLNETCKNAMNIQDFIHSIKLTTQDFETTGRIGFVDGISRIFINELKRLEIERRPLHCTDVKRETVYVKDNDTWEKENQEKKKLKWAINSIAQLNLNQVQEWQQEYPECRENNTKANTHFNKMAMVALGGFGDVEETKFRDKIVKNVLKEIIIDKEN